MDQLTKMTGPMAAAWGRLTALQKAALALIAVLSTVSLLVALSIASRPQYSVLFSNLSSTDASAIVEKLKDSKTDYRLTSGGAAIEVPSKEVYDLRLRLAGQGLPHGGSVGFEIFDKTTFGMTEFTQKLNYQRALQGELARTIGELDPVAQARVHIAMPEKNLFADKEKESTASVILKLRPGAQLNSEQVEAVTHLVASAVEDLKPRNVAVADTEGNLLSDTGSGSGGTAGYRASGAQLQAQKQYELLAARDLQLMLEKVLGPGKAVVRVNARMNFDAKQTNSETFQPAANGKPGQPAKGVLTSEDASKENFNGAAKSMPGAPVLSSTPGGAASGQAGGKGDAYTRSQNTMRYEVSKKTENVTQSPGKVEKLSVAVLLDGTVSPSALRTLKQTIAAAAGIDPTRGDQVTVDRLPFDTSAAKSEQKDMEKAASQERTMSLAKYGASVLLAVVFLLFLRSFLVKWKPIEVTESYAEPLTLREAAALEGESGASGANAHGPERGESVLEHRERSMEYPPHEDDREPAILGDRPLDLVSDEPATPLRLPVRSPAELVRERPDDVAKVLRSWLAEID